MTRRILISLLFLVVATGSAFSSSIQYQLTSLGGDLYRYDYTVFNDGSLGAGVPIEGIDIYFDAALYDELSLAPFAPAGWDPIIIYSIPGIPALYDVIALSPADGIPVGSSLSGFVVEFSWLGLGGSPGTQPYDVISPIEPYPILESGETSAIPEPSTIALVGIGLAALLWWKRRMC